MTEEQGKFWKEGYETGIRANLNQNGKAIRIGNAILEVLDERYEFKKEDF